VPQALRAIHSVVDFCKIKVFTMLFKNSRTATFGLRMQIIDLIAPLNALGTAVFALTGAISAVKKRFDLFGMIFLAGLVGLGGGTLRDVLLGRLPVFWVREPWDLLITTSVAILAFIFLKIFSRLKSLFLWADALGLATFAIVGASIALHQGVSPFLAPVFGMFTACFGGLMRDVIANERPLILYGELYASAALAGSAVYTFVVVMNWGDFLAAVSALVTGLTMRAIGIIWQVHLPTAKLPLR
jgi:uncharacterized membrane protein YeiH